MNKPYFIPQYKRYAYRRWYKGLKVIPSSYKKSSDAEYLLYELLKCLVKEISQPRFYFRNSCWQYNLSSGSEWIFKWTNIWINWILFWFVCKEYIGNYYGNEWTSNSGYFQYSAWIFGLFLRLSTFKWHRYLCAPEILPHLRYFDMCDNLLILTLMTTSLNCWNTHENPTSGFTCN